MTGPRHGADWDSAVSRFDPNAHYLDAFLGDLKRRAHLGLIERWDGLPASGRVLKTDLFEEAVGPDAYLLELGRRGATVIGMDVSPTAAGRAQARFAACRIIAADARRLPFADGCFALIVSPSTLDHFPEPGDLSVSLRELARVLEPGGRLIITLDNRQNIFDPLLRLAVRVGLVPYYLGRSYTRRANCATRSKAPVSSWVTRRQYCTTRASPPSGPWRSRARSTGRGSRVWCSGPSCGPRASRRDGGATTRGVSSRSKP